MSKPSPDDVPAPSLGELAWAFLRLGLLSFGGPAAHIALMEDEFVIRRRWLSHEKFLDLLGAANLIPGPSSTELAIHIGYLKAGWRGLIVAGVCFILPAMLIVWALAWAYDAYHALPYCDAILYGVKPVVVVVVFQALVKLGRTAARTPALARLAAAVTLLSLLGADALLLLAVAGVAACLGRLSIKGSRCFAYTAAVVALFLTPWRLARLHTAGFAATAGQAAEPAGLWPLFLVFLKVGSVLYGSGYVLLAFLRSDLVERLHWLSEQQLLDAVAVGQVTPGPVFTTATFIGYLVAGSPGAIVATVAIFLPGFVLVALSGPIVPRLRRSPVAAAFLDGVNAASLALMAAVTLQLGASVLLGPRGVDGAALLLTLVGAILLFRFRLNSAWLLLLGATAGLVAGLIGWR